jgi:hypothetical protein
VYPEVTATDAVPMQTAKKKLVVTMVDASEAQTGADYVREMEIVRSKLVLLDAV